MNSGDLFEFNGDKFVARAKVADGWLCSRMVTNGSGEERPTVGKPRLFKNGQLDNAPIVGSYNLNKPKTRSAPKDEPVEKPAETYAPEPERSPEEIAAEMERKREVVERLLQKHSGGDNWDLT